jgi:large subunit ribosomal protein L13
MDATHDWHVVNAEGEVLGRLATRIATLLRGKHKPTYTPSTDGGDYVVVVNCSKVALTRRKSEQKKYYRHSGYPGGLTETPFLKMMETHPTRVVETAVRGMLPRTSLGKDMMRKLRLYAGPDHPHAGQIASAKGE